MESRCSGPFGHVGDHGEGQSVRSGHGGLFFQMDRTTTVGPCTPSISNVSVGRSVTDSVIGLSKTPECSSLQ